MEETTKVSREALRQMHIGQTRIFSMEPPRLVNSARVTCNQLKNEEGLIFRVSPDYKAKAVCITRIG